LVRLEPIGFNTEGKTDMKFTLEIDLDNAAFSADIEGDSNDRNALEVSRILSLVANRLYMEATISRGSIARLRDVNGNACGQWHVSQ
jgi:hypothetical protein